MLELNLSQLKSKFRNSLRTQRSSTPSARPSQCSKPWPTFSTNSMRSPSGPKLKAATWQWTPKSPFGTKSFNIMILSVASMLRSMLWMLIRNMELKEKSWLWWQETRKNRAPSPSRGSTWTGSSTSRKHWLKDKEKQCRNEQKMKKLFCYLQNQSKTKI